MFLLSEPVYDFHLKVTNIYVYKFELLNSTIIIETKYLNQKRFTNPEYTWLHLSSSNKIKNS